MPMAEITRAETGERGRPVSDLGVIPRGVPW